MAALMAASTVSMAQVFKADTISNEVFARMEGKSYPIGCVIPRSELRYLSVAHYDLSGKVCQGELVCNRAIAGHLLEIFRELFRRKYPIERIRLVDDYDADDERSMRANNTSCFNFRRIAGSTKLSAHSRGMAIDINPLYNPYVKKGKQGQMIVYPATGKPFTDRSCNFDYKIEKNDICYRLFIQRGFSWGGDWHSVKDYQHFER